MFLNPPKNSSKTKKAVYLFASIILGVMLSFIAHAVIEINYLNWVQRQGITVTFYNHCALLPSLQISLMFLGIIGGYFLGQFWWDMVYVRKVRFKKSK